jgi:hypothetical protein
MIRPTTSGGVIVPKTGPTSTQGKDVASRNSITHGARARAIVLPNVEREEDWRAFRDGLVSSLCPEGPLEEYLATRVAELAWRLGRITRAEHDAAFLNQARHADLIQDKERAATALGARSFYGAGLAQAAERARRNLPYNGLPDLGQVQLLTRYEAHLSRQMYAALHELEARQSQRKGEGTPLARVQVHGLPGL